MAIKTRHVRTPYGIDGEAGKDCQSWDEVKSYAEGTLNPGQSLVAWIKGSYEGETRRWICTPQKEIMEVENW